MHIVLDAMGSDQHPQPEVSAAYQASDQFGIQVSLVGQKEKLAPLMDHRGSNPKVHLVHAPEVLEMTDSPECQAKIG